MTSPYEQRLSDLGCPLPSAPAAVGFYVPALRVGDLVLTSGQLPFVGKELAFKGKVGSELTEGDGQSAARLCAVNALAQIKAILGSLDAIEQVVRVEGYVNSAPGFQAQPHIINGASQLLVDVFGEKGKHTRVALGISEMPMNAAVQLAIWVKASA